MEFLERAVTIIIMSIMHAVLHNLSTSARSIPDFCTFCDILIENDTLSDWAGLPVLKVSIVAGKQY